MNMAYISSTQIIHLVCNHTIVWTLQTFIRQNPGVLCNLYINVIATAESVRLKNNDEINIIK